MHRPTFELRLQLHPRRLSGLATLLATLLLATSSSLAATATFTNTANGRAVSGMMNGSPRSVGYAGTFNIQIDNVPPSREAYCVDINNGIAPGDTVPQAPVDYPLEVLFILNNAFPQPNTIGTPLANLNDEAAAVQSAVWSYTDNFIVDTPSNVATRAAEIVAAANAAAPHLPTTVPQSISLTPPSAANFLPGDTSHSVTATLLDANANPLNNFSIQMEVISGPATGQSTSGPSPSVTLNYTNASAGIDTIEASTIYSVPTGQKFKMAGKQGIVLAGLPVQGSVTGTATSSWVTPACGNGATEPGEQCDDGNGVNTDGCKNDCTLPVCGDGFTQPGEQCDDGNQNQNDPCKNNCRLNTCGDQIVNPSAEDCDDGNAVNNDGCTNACHSPACGDGILQTGEQCDDGNAVNNDACSNACTVPVCGDAITQAPEQCDDGNAVNNDACTNGCRLAVCGDGITQPPEQCDDANANNNDGCTNTCMIPFCGDGIQQAGEQCDDGNAVNNDACSNSCMLPVCGDGITQPPEQCDDDNSVNNDGCTNACTLPACGDGIQQGNEQCDDGNVNNTDGCSNQCTVGRCGDGITQPPEECDDGNNLNGDGCTATCQIGEICADQIDNDGDVLVDCDDPDCGCLEITPICKHPCPGKITFRDKDPSHDKFGFQASFAPSGPIDPVNSTFGVTITNSNGIVWSATLLPGDIRPNGKSNTKFLFRDKTATTGPGLRGGLNQLKLKQIEPGIWRINLLAYAELAAATEATMTIQIVIGNEAFQRSAVWGKVKSGWRVKMHN